MGNQIVIIAGAPSCLTLNKMKAQFEAAGKETSFVSPSEEGISAITSDVGAVIIYLDFSAGQSFYDSLSDSCAEKGIGPFFVGRAEELERESVKLSANVKRECVERPVNVPELVNRVVETMKSNASGGSLSETAERKKLLVIDDSAMTLRMITMWLSKDFEVTPADGAERADKVLIDFEPDMILLDYEMPVCSGPEYYERLRANEKTRHLPVFFLTGVSDEESLSKIEALKPEGYFIKTMEPAAIIAGIKEFFK